MSDNEPKQSPSPQKGGTQVRPPVEGAPQQNQEQFRINSGGFKSFIKKGVNALGIAGVMSGVVTDDKSISAQPDIKPQAFSQNQIIQGDMPTKQAFNARLTSYVDSAPTPEQLALSLDQILAKSLIDTDQNVAREKLKLNPVDVIHSTQRLDFNGNITSEYFLVKDRAGINRVFFRDIEPDGTMSKIKLAGNVLPMENARKIAVDSQGNILVVGQKTKKVSSPPGMAFLRVNNPLQFEDVSMGYDNKYGDLTFVIPTKRPGTFLVNFSDSDTSTVDGIKIAALGLQASQGVLPQVRITSATILLKGTSLNIGTVGDMSSPSPSDFQALAENKMGGIFVNFAGDGKVGVTEIEELDIDTGEGSADQKVPQIGYAHKFSVIDSKNEIIANNTSSKDVLVFNPTTEVIDLKKSFNYRKLVESNPRFPEASGSGVITGIVKVGDRYIATVSYRDAKAGQDGTALFDWDALVDIDANPELMNIQIIKDIIEGGPESMTLVKYNGIPALSIDLSKKLGKAIVPVSSSGVPDISHILYDDLGMQSNIAVLPAAPIKYSSAGK